MELSRLKHRVFVPWIAVLASVLFEMMKSHRHK